MALGKNIRLHREGQGLTLDRLSEICGVDIGTISALENRDSQRSKYATAIARGLGLTLEELELGETAIHPPPPPPKTARALTLPDPPEIAEVLRLMRATDDRGRLMAMGAVKHDLADHKPAVKASGVP